jgi:RNA polymerase sigma-70 factor (ECF subfamily)
MEVPPAPRSTDIEMRIRDARDGTPEAISQLTEACRQYLLMIANAELDPGVRRKAGASDIVQEALMAAQQDFGSFRGNSEAELRRWVRKILVNKIASSWRFYGETARRDIHRELEIRQEDERDDLIDPHPTPHQQALATERTSAIESVLSRLPEHYQQIITMRSFDHRSFAEIGEHLSISTDAARKMWCRALESFRREWEKAVKSV